MSRTPNDKAQQAQQPVTPRTDTPDRREVRVSNAAPAPRLDAEKLHRSLADCAYLTSEVCDWLESILSAAIQNIGPEPGQRIHARRLLEIALHHVQTLDNDVTFTAEQHGIEVMQEGRK